MRSTVSPRRVAASDVDVRRVIKTQCIEDVYNRRKTGTSRMVRQENGD